MKCYVLFCLVLFGAGTAFAVELPNPHEGRLVKVDSEYGSASAGFNAVSAIISDQAKEPGGDEAHYFDVWLNPRIDFTKSVGDGQQIGFSWDFIVPENVLVDEPPGTNWYRAEGDLARPEHLARFFFQKAYSQGFLEISIGQDFFAGFMPLVQTTNYYGADPSLFVHSWQYDQGIAVQWTGYAGMREAWKVKGSMVNGNGGFGMRNPTIKDVSDNSSPGWTLKGEVHPLLLFGAGKEFTKTYGDFVLEGSVVEADRGSYPGAKRSSDHLIGGMKWVKDIFGYEFQLRGSVGTLTRGLTDYPLEESRGFAVEAAVNNILVGKSFLTSYAYISGLKYVEGFKNELWLPGTSYQKQYGFGLRLDHPCGWKNVYVSGCAVFKKTDGEKERLIIDDDNVYCIEAGFSF